MMLIARYFILNTLKITHPIPFISVSVDYNHTNEGGYMGEPCRTVFDLQETLYRTALWMTGSKILARELVVWTYRDVVADTTLNELLKRFRAYYFSNFSIDLFSCFMETGCSRAHDLQDDSTGRYYDDIKLAVVLADMFGMTQHEISEINGTDLDTLKIWLWWGRKTFVLLQNAENAGQAGNQF